MEIGHGSGRRHRVGVGSEQVRGGLKLRPGSHVPGEGGHHYGTAHQGRVYKVLADAAKELLGNHDGEKAAHKQRKIGHAHGADKRQQHTRDHCGKIAHGLLLLHKLAVYPLPRRAENHAGTGHSQRPKAKRPNSVSKGGQHGDNHVQHNGTGVFRGADMGRRRGDQLQIFIVGHLSRLLLLCLVRQCGGLFGGCLIGGRFILYQLLAGFKHMSQMNPGGADIGARAAFHAVHNVGGVQLLGHPLGGILVHKQGLQLHRTDGNALAAADALGVLHGLLLVFTKRQNRAGALGHRDVRSVLGHAHHRAAGDQLICTVLQAAAGVQQVCHGGPDGTLQILRVNHAGAGDGNHLGHHRQPLGDGPVDGAGGVDVEHGAADGGGQSSRRDLLAGNGLAELLFTALGVTAVQGFHHHGGMLLGNDLVHGVNSVALVVFHTDDDLIHAKHFGQINRASDDFLGALQHGAMVACDVGLALRAVDDHGVDLADTAGNLHMGGEGCAAHADNASFLDDLHHLFDGECIGVRGSLDLFAQLVFHVVFDHDGGHVAPHGIGTGLHGLYRAGNAGVNRCAQAAELADFLSDLHMVTRFDKGCARSAEVHGHGDDHLSRGRQLFDGLFIGGGLHIMGMNTAEKRLCHCFHLIFLLVRALKVALPHTAHYSTPKMNKCPDCKHRFSQKFVLYLTNFVYLLTRANRVLPSFPMHDTLVKRRAVATSVPLLYEMG
ncbi:hypothetical protein SDC9_78665 [bioreactor metagenome]|uniref:NAD-specific glutamate dehydrogenase n=1 Tax=bioreactor metagenome TaxID=1076179 RepID=A0A644YUA1_9ZZZZ